VSSASATRARDRRGAESAARERLWHLYSNDTELREVILRVEALIDDGRLKLRGAGDNCENDKSGINAKSAGSFMDDISLRQKFRDVRIARFPNPGTLCAHTRLTLSFIGIRPWVRTRRSGCEPWWT
jgi:hypothetical protein